MYIGKDEIDLETYKISDDYSSDILNNLAHLASLICDASIAIVIFADGELQCFESSFGLEKKLDLLSYKNALHDSLQEFEVNGIKNNNYSGDFIIRGKLDIGFYISIPILNSTNCLVGALCIIDQEEKHLEEHQKKGLFHIGKEITSKIKLGNTLFSNNNCNLEKLEDLQKDIRTYESLIESAPVGITYSDLDGNFIKTNRFFEKMMEYSKDELLDIQISKLTHPDDVQITRENIEKLNMGELKDFTIEKRYYTKNGKLRWGRVSCALVLGSKGISSYLIASIEDITEKRKLEETYRFNAERLDLAIKGANEGIWDWLDVNSEVQWWSPRFYELLGYKEEELEASSDTFTKILLHPQDLAQTRKAIDDCFQKNIPIDIEYRLKTKSGNYKWFRGRGNMTSNEIGEPIRMTGSISDIDRSKSLALKLEKTEKFLSKVTNIVPSIIYVFNQKTMSNEYANKELGSVMGFSDTEIQNMGSELMPTLCHPDDFTSVIQHFSKVQTLKDDDVLQLEYRLKHKDGRYRWLLSVDTVFERDFDGSVLKHLGIAADITKIKNTQHELSEQTKRLKKRNDDLKQFNYVATHDLKSPIVTLMSYIDLLKKEVKENTPKISLAFKHIEKELQSFISTQKGLTQAIKIREDELIANKINVSLLLEEILNSYQLELDSIGGTFDLQIERKLHLESNEVYFKSIIQNLISNAIKYRADERPLVIKVNAQRIKNDLVISIADNGLGIDLKLQQNHIFGMFNRFHNHSEGSGMGLYIVKSMVERLNGNISIESEVGKGTYFQINFKLK